MKESAALKGRALSISNAKTTYCREEKRWVNLSRINWVSFNRTKWVKANRTYWINAIGFCSRYGLIVFMTRP